MGEGADQRSDRLSVQEGGELGPQLSTADCGVDRLAGHQHPDLDQGRHILRLPPAIAGVEQARMREAHQGGDLATIRGLPPAIGDHRTCRDDQRMSRYQFRLGWVIGNFLLVRLPWLLRLGWGTFLARQVEDHTH